MNWRTQVPLAIVGVVIVLSIFWVGAERATVEGVPTTLGMGTARACRGLSGEVAERVRACTAEVEAVEPSREAREVFDELLREGKLFSIGAEVSRYATRSLSDHPEVERLLLDDDEEAVSKALRDLEVRAVVVHRDLVGALDRDDLVMSRLAYHSHLEWFQLRHVAADYFVYSVRRSPARLPLATGDRILEGLRQRLAGQRVRPQEWAPRHVMMMGTMRLQGKLLVIRYIAGSGQGGRFERLLDQLADKLRREWTRQVEPMGHGRLEDRLGDIRLEVHVIMERALVEPRSRDEIFELWEQGVDGVLFRQRKRPGQTPEQEKFTYLPGSELVTNSFGSADRFLRHAVDMFGWHDARPWEKDPRTRLEIMRTSHFMEADRGGGPAVRLVRGLPEVPMSWVTDRNVQDMLVAGGEWWLHELRPDGSFEYKYWPVQNRRSGDYNEVRHILGARDLADTYRYRNDRRYLDGSKRSMDWLMQFAVDATDEPQGPLPHPPPDTMLFRYPSYALEKAVNKQANQKLGTVAVGLLGWIAWADASGSRAEDRRIRRMANYVKSQQEKDGRFRAYNVHDRHSYRNSKNDIVPGEAMLALGMVAEYFDEPEWVADYGKFVDYYEPWFDKRAARKVPTGRWPHDTYRNQDRLDLVQFGPWSVMAAKQVYRLTQREDAAEFGLKVADWMIDNYQWSGERSPWPDYVGGYYKLPEELPAMQTFCYSEGTAAAYTLASRYAPERKGKYEQSTAEAIRFLEVMQYDDLDSYFVARPEKVRGGVKYTMSLNKVRTDYVGHGLSTLSQWLDARDYDPAVDLDIHDPSDLARLAGSRNSVPDLDYPDAALRIPAVEVVEP